MACGWASRSRPVSSRCAGASSPTTARAGADPPGGGQPRHRGPLQVRPVEPTGPATVLRLSAAVGRRDGRLVVVADLAEVVVAPAAHPDHSGVRVCGVARDAATAAAGSRAHRH